MKFKTYYQKMKSTVHYPYMCQECGCGSITLKEHKQHMVDYHE